MPIHDWTRVHESLFHNFHLGWVAEICGRLNQGVLPTSHFAMSETLDLRPSIGFAAMPEPEPHERRGSARVSSHQLRSVLEDPPSARFIVRRDEIQYANRTIT